MIVAGCDIGSLTTKVVLFDGKKILASSIIKSKPKPEDGAYEALQQACAIATVNQDTITYCVGTGYGRKRVPFANDTISEISCHTKGAFYLYPNVRTIIDIGGQDCKVISLNTQGEVDRFVTNDKCAAGTGRFLEVMAKVLKVELQELSNMAKKGNEAITLASACTVWAQADVIKYLNEGISKENIALGVCKSMAKRVGVLVNQASIKKDVCITGGVAKNTAVVKELENLLGVTIIKITNVDPQLTGALGAALFAYQKAGGK
ncbi:MAG: 2-hydroxyglutaryl-CoA dehydratase [Spirochaetes bacterium]|nr:acyl-CoA dehydratase activase [Spirochaetota bacterium]NMB64506.1 2-hydroxyglutaryl-CoA dehydratase [Spirochaetota bacterium]HOJ29498.1 acyl-CoA dehydratase activase [Spirochaetota bacterium]HOM10060.1 acyl-CoA dehydratase activase [Spirochaetota bacterium]HPP50104.1 acyl-CoA dehydratase activase [Spirochaetota bacterium]